MKKKQNVLPTVMLISKLIRTASGRLPCLLAGRLAYFAVKKVSLDDPVEAFEMQFHHLGNTAISPNF